MPAKKGPLRPHEERRNYDRRVLEQPLPGDPGLGDSFLIVTEGEVTEKLYFDSVRALLKRTAVEVRVDYTDWTDAIGLVRAAMNMYEKDSAGNRVAKKSAGFRSVDQYDHVWVLFDTDVPGPQRQLGPALELAERENIHIGHSTPCVELWLLLHFRDRPGDLDSVAAERALREAWGQHYDKSERTFRKLWEALKPRIPAAVIRGRQIREYHEKAGAKFPANPSTELDLLVLALNASVQPPLRIIR